jgi:hypothetical protein
MAIQTKQSLVDEIVYELYDGMPPVERSLSDQFILRKVNNYIADAAMKSAFQSSNIEGVVYADDIFRLTYTTLSLQTDNFYQLQFCTLPALPVGLPRQRAFEVFSTGTDPGLFKVTSRGSYQRIKALPSLKKVFCFVENGKMYFDFSFVDPLTVVATVNMSIITSGALDLTATINLPDDMITGLKASIITELRQTIGFPLQPETSPQH